MTDEAGDDPPDVPIICPECETTSRVPVPDVAEALERHNEQFHDGADVAEVDPTLSEQLADLVADDLGLLPDRSPDGT